MDRQKDREWRDRQTVRDGGKKERKKERRLQVCIYTDTGIIVKVFLSSDTLQVSTYRIYVSSKNPPCFDPLFTSMLFFFSKGSLILLHKQIVTAKSGMQWYCIRDMCEVSVF